MHIDWSKKIARAKRKKILFERKVKKQKAFGSANVINIRQRTYVRADGTPVSCISGDIWGTYGPLQLCGIRSTMKLVQWRCRQERRKKMLHKRFRNSKNLQCVLNRKEEFRGFPQAFSNGASTSDVSSLDVCYSSANLKSAKVTPRIETCVLGENKMLGVLPTGSGETQQTSSMKTSNSLSPLLGTMNVRQTNDVSNHSPAPSEQESNHHEKPLTVVWYTRRRSMTRTRCRTGNQCSRDFYRRLNNVAEQTRNFTAKAMKAPHDSSQYTNICGGRYARTHDHSRSVLEHILKSPEIKGADGIKSSIKDALMHGHPAKNNLNYSDTSEPRDKHNHLDVLNNGIHNQTLEAIANKKKCQDILSKVLCSEKFLLLCNLLCESFRGIKVDKVFDFSQINENMKSGVYEQSPRLFNLDIQQMWRKLEKIGEEITQVASSLSNMSCVSSMKQVEDDIIHEAGPQNFEDNCQTAAAVSANNFNGSAPDTIIPGLNQIEAGPPKICLCKQCGNKTTNGNERILICGKCESSYHFSCIDPSFLLKEISSESKWICASCSNKSIQPLALSLHNDIQVHNNCGVCERLDIPTDEKGFLYKENKEQQLALLPPVRNNENSRDSSIFIKNSNSSSDEKQLASSSTLLRLCKQCGTHEDEDMRFIICGHSQCPYKYYHIRCLKSRQIASFQQQNRQCWYCPSCLCRACFQDRDNNLIVLCNGCNEVYHTYCMKPPKSSVPKGRWYCLQCNMEKAKEGMRKYEEWILKQHEKKNDNVHGNATSEDHGSLDVLLRAVDTVNGVKKKIKLN